MFTTKVHQIPPEHVETREDGREVASIVDSIETSDNYWKVQ
jgi:hypothetical protein